MFTVKRKQTFEYAHRLMSHEGNCRFLHGHSGEAEVEIAVCTLDDQGMVIDFAQLKRAMSSLLEAWDHTTLLQKNDPLKPALLLLGQRVYTFEEQPTAEVMARELYNHLQTFFPGSVKTVTISETRNNRATYTGIS